jgi:hypothetical protein
MMRCREAKEFLTAQEAVPISLQACGPAKWSM